MKNLYVLTPHQVEELKAIKCKIENNTVGAIKDLDGIPLDGTIIDERLDNIVMLLEEMDEILELE